MKTSSRYYSGFTRTLFAAVALCVAPGVFADREVVTVGGLVRASQEEVAAERYDEAVALGRRAVDMDPAYAPAWRQYGIALLRADRSEEAVNAFLRAVTLVDDDAVAWRGLAQARGNVQQQGEAVRALSAYLRLKPGDVVAWRDMATWQIELGSSEQAISALERVVDLDPGVFSAWRELGSLHIRQGRTAEAAEALGHASELQPGDPAVQRDLGWALWTLGRRDEAVAHLEKAISLGVSSHESVMLQVLARLSEEGAEEEAMSFYRRQYPDELLSNPGLAVARHGRLQAAEPLLLAAWEAGDRTPEAGLYLSYARAVNRRFAGIANYMGPFLERAGEASAEQVDLALETLRLGSGTADVSDLIERLESAVEHTERFEASVTDILEATAETQRVRHETERALRIYRRVLERDPDRTSWFRAFLLAESLDKEAHAWLNAHASRVSDPALRAGIEGLMADRVGRPVQAVEFLHESVTLLPEQPEIRRLLFMNLVRLGRKREARAQTLWFGRRVEQGESTLRPYLAEMFTRLGEFEDALAHWQLLRMSNPEHGYYVVETAYVLYRLGRPEEAVDLLREAVMFNPEAQFYEWLVEISAAGGNPGAAAEWAAAGLAEAPSPALLRAHAEYTEMAGTDFESALESANAYLKNDPGHVPMNLLAGRGLMKLDRLDEAEEHYEGLLERNPSFVPALSALRDLAMSRSRIGEALNHAAMHNSVQAGHADTRRRYAHTQAQDERFRSALKTLRDLSAQPIHSAVPVLIYRSIVDKSYPGRNSVEQISGHIERLAELGYGFVNRPDLVDQHASKRRVMIVLLDPDESVIMSIDPVLQQFNARVLYAGSTALPFRGIPSMPFPESCRHLLDTERWQLASSGTDDPRRRPINADGVLGNPLAHPVMVHEHSENQEEYAERLHRELAAAARPLVGEPFRLLVYPDGDFGQRSFDTSPKNMATLREVVADYFTHAVYFDDSGFYLPENDPLRIPARRVSADWDDDRLEEALTKEHPLVRARMDLARVLYWHGQHDAAQRAFVRAHEAGADIQDLTYTWGMNAHLLGDHPTSLEMLREARELDPESERVAGALDRAATAGRPRATVFLRGWRDNEDRRMLQAGGYGDLFLSDALRLGVAADRNRWQRAGQGSEEGTRLGLRALAFLRPHVWLDARLWRLHMDDLSNMWGGQASLRLPNPWLSGSLSLVAAREEMETVEALRANIEAKHYAARTHTRLLDVFDLFADLTRTERTDDNATAMLEGRLLYRVTEWPFTGVGWRFRFADSDADPPEYWAPEELEQHQLHLTLRRGDNRLRATLSADLGYARERDTDWRFVWGARGAAELALNSRIGLFADVVWFEGPVYERLTAGAGLSGRF